MSQNIVVVLGAGPNIGLHITKHFSSKGFKTVIVSRNPGEDITAAADLAIAADFSDPTSIKGIFEAVKAQIGTPNVVVYNGVFFISPSPGVIFETIIDGFQHTHHLSTRIPSVSHSKNSQAA